MKVTIAEVPLAPENGIANVQLRAPGLVRAAALTLKPRGVVALDGHQEMDEELVLFVECDPGAPMRSRKFLALSIGQVFTPKEGTRALYTAMARSEQTGSMVHVFELLQSGA